MLTESYTRVLKGKELKWLNSEEKPRRWRFHLLRLQRHHSQPWNKFVHLLDPLDPTSSECRNWMNVTSLSWNKDSYRCPRKAFEKVFVLSCFPVVTLLLTICTHSYLGRALKKEGSKLSVLPAWHLTGMWLWPKNPTVPSTEWSCGFSGPRGQ